MKTKTLPKGWKEVKAENLKNAKGILTEISDKGLEITNVIKKNLSKPVRTYGNFRATNGIFLPKKYTDSKMLIEPNLFFLTLFEQFWNIFKLVANNIENPLILPWIRTLIEESSDIFYYSQKKEHEKRDLACKYWLCTLGFLGGKHGSLDYNVLLGFLEDKKEKSNFLKLRNEGYPVDKVHRYWKDCFPAINKNNLPPYMAKYFLNIKGNFISREGLDGVYRNMSLYNHPNVAITANLENDLINKSHIFKCFSLMSISALSLIKFSTAEIIKKPEMNFSDDFHNKFNDAVRMLYGERKNEN